VLCLLASSPSQGRSTLIVLIALRESLKLLVAVTLVDLVTLCYYSYLGIALLIIILITPFVPLQFYGSAGPQGVLYVFAFIYYIPRIMYMLFYV
jgi:hypothetical protein